MTSLRYFLPTSQLKGKQMAARLLKDIVPGAWGENLTPLESRGGRRGAGRARRTLDATFHFILLPHLPPATEPSFGIFSQGTDLGHSLSSCSWGQQQHPLNLPLVVPWALKTLLSIGWLMQKEDSRTRLAILAHHSPKKNTSLWCPPCPVHAPPNKPNAIPSAARGDAPGAGILLLSTALGPGGLPKPPKRCTEEQRIPRPVYH